MYKKLALFGSIKASRGSPGIKRGIRKLRVSTPKIRIEANCVNPISSRYEVSLKRGRSKRFKNIVRIKVKTSSRKVNR